MKLSTQKYKDAKEKTLHIFYKITLIALGVLMFS